MQPLGRLFPFGVIVPSVVGATVVAFAAGSSSVAAANSAGKPLRWVMLLVLLAVSASWAASRWSAVSLPRSPLAVAAAFLVLALVSTFWSVDPRLTAGRAGSFVLLFAVGACLAFAGAGDAEAIRLVLGGILGGAAVVAVVGLLVLALEHADAVQSATYDSPWRYRGFGENPNTVSLLLALVLPVALWFALSTRRAAFRLLAAGLLLLFAGSIGTSGSRGALAAGFVGVFLVVALAPLSLRVRSALALGAGALLVASLAAGEIAEPTGKPPPPSASRSGSKYVDAEKALPLSFDIGTSAASGAHVGPRGLFGSSGRSVAWRGAIDTARERPALGHGFGTESKAFIDRYAAFEGDLTENSYIGLALQLGVVGLAGFGALLAVIVAVGLRALPRPEAAVCLAVLVAGLLQAVVQSYVFSVGNIATASLWTCGFLVVAAAAPPKAAG